MSIMEKVLSIQCDKCLDWQYGNIRQSAAEMRSELRKLGWRVNVPVNGRRLDYCPRCKDEV